MSAELTDDMLARIRQILGGDPPAEPYDPHFHEAYETVAETDPDLAAQWLASFEEEEAPAAPRVTLPVEQRAKQARRGAQWRDRVDRLFKRKIDEEDSPTAAMPDQRRISLVAFGGLVSLGLILFVIFLGSGHHKSAPAKPSPSATTATAVKQPDQAVVVVPPQPAPAKKASTDAGSTSGSAAAATPAAPPAAPTPAPAPAPAPAPSTYTSADSYSSTSSGQGQSDSSGPPASVVYQQAAPQATLAAGVTAGNADPAAGGKEQAVVFQGEGPKSGGVMVGGNQMQSVAQQADKAVVFQAHGPSVSGTDGTIVTTDASGPAKRDAVLYTASAAGATPSNASASNPIVYGAGSTQANGAGSSNSSEAYTPTAAPSPQSGSAGIPATPPATLGAALAQTGSSAPTSSSAEANSGAASSVAASQSASAAAPAPQPANIPADVTKPDGSAFRMAERIPAHLVTSATILDGTPAPVIAETSGEWCAHKTCPTYSFVGQAKLMGGNRVIINFTKVVTPQGIKDVKAIALSTEYSTSIPATVRDSTPTIAPDLIRASLNGVSQWADALANMKTVTTNQNGQSTQQNALPDLKSLIAGNAAKALGLPQSATTVVRIAEVKPDTNVIIAMGLTY